MLHPLS